MSYQVLARKYRPQKFSDVIGQEHVTRTLKNAIERSRIAHGYIFSGHRGIGKHHRAHSRDGADGQSQDHPVPEPCGVSATSCREIRAGNAVGGVIEIDAATNRGIDEIRELREAARYRPARDRFKIYILDEAHQITDAAFNALLEDAGEAAQPHRFHDGDHATEDIPQTIRSRCQHFSFHAVRFDDIVQQLRDIARREGIEADDNALAMLAEAGDGSMRDALSIMDQAIASCGTTPGADIVRGLVGECAVGSAGRHDGRSRTQFQRGRVAHGRSPSGGRAKRATFRPPDAALPAQRHGGRKLSGSDSQVLQISSDERARVARVAERFSEEDLARFMQIMLRTHSDLGYKQEQRFHLELGLLKLVHAQRLLPLEELLSGEAGKSSAAGSSSRPSSSSSRPAAVAPRPTAVTRSSTGERTATTLSRRLRPLANLLRLRPTATARADRRPRQLRP